LLDRPVQKLNDCIGDEVVSAVNSMKDGDVILLENLRFHKEETDNDPEFAKRLASLADIFVNDAFGTCHRAHASTEGVTRYLESAAGFLLQKEIEYFQKVVTAPEKPFVLILGGAKVADKIPVIENMLDKADTILIGGGMAYTFLKVQGAQIGSSKFEQDMKGTAGDTLGKAKQKGVNIVLPVDHVITQSIEDPSSKKTTDGKDIEPGWIGVDIGPKTIELFKKECVSAKTIVWNGPMGIFEKDAYAEGTRQIAEYIADLQVATIIGGGDTAAAVKKFKVDDKMSHISTGGGASLEYLEGKAMPGVSALTDKEVRV